jgi:hypothetical protein
MVKVSIAERYLMNPMVRILTQELREGMCTTSVIQALYS